MTASNNQTYSYVYISMCISICIYMYAVLWLILNYNGSVWHLRQEKHGKLKYDHERF